MRMMVCFDGSEPARGALPVACEIAQAATCEVHMVRVAPHRLRVDGVAWSGSNAVDIEKHRKAMEEDRELRLEMEGVCERFGDGVIVTVLDGTRVADELIHYARSQDIDLIVMGCREHGPMHPGVGGSVTSRVVESRIAPVLLGPMVPRAHLDLRAIPPGCAVFSWDGTHLGELMEVRSNRIHIRATHGRDYWLAEDDALELSVASGLRLRFDAEELDSRKLEPLEEVGAR
jgi:nucleotide-binding universal stress UspA family protein